MALCTSAVTATCGSLQNGSLSEFGSDFDVECESEWQFEVFYVRAGLKGSSVADLIFQRIVVTRLYVLLTVLFFRLRHLFDGTHGGGTGREFSFHISIEDI